MIERLATDSVGSITTISIRIENEKVFSKVPAEADSISIVDDELDYTGPFLGTGTWERRTIEKYGPQGRRVYADVDTHMAWLVNDYEAQAPESGPSDGFTFIGEVVGLAHGDEPYREKQKRDPDYDESDGSVDRDTAVGPFVTDLPRRD